MREPLSAFLPVGLAGLLAGLPVACAGPSGRLPDAPPTPVPSLVAPAGSEVAPHGASPARSPGSDGGGESGAAAPPATSPEPAQEVLQGGAPDRAGTAPAGEGGAAKGPGAGVLGSIAGEALTVGDLLREWQDLAGRDLWVLVDRLVATRLAFAEADRLGVRLLPEALEARLSSERERLAREFGAADRGLSLEEYVRQELGREPGEYFAALRRATIRQMIAERAVRAWVLANPNAAVRLLVVGSREEADEVLAELEKGADFAELARTRSLDESAPDGGYVAYLVNQERSPLSRLAFATEVGAVAGPLPAADRYVVLRVEEKRAPREGLWSVVGPAVEASLQQDPVKDSEFVHWKLAMERTYPIELSGLQEILDRRE